MSEQKTLNRREFLQRAALLGAVTVGAGALLTACDSDGGGSSEAATTATPEADGFTCNSAQDLEGLTDAQREARAALNYVDQTPNPAETCDNCALWTDPVGGAQCGGCTGVPGPIHPDGWCDIYTAA